ncbi:MAG: glutathione S-transferase [Rhodobacteraceae bacterium]|nr:glutathione S-transferase [Paracoccaceae bacterium]
MKLFHSPTSPYVRKVMVLLKETGQAADVELIPAAGSPVDPGTMPTGYNPLGKIPALVLDDGLVLYDSRVICQFLDDRAGGGLFPAPPLRWRCLTLESLADGILDAAVLMRYESVVRPEEIRLEAWVEGQWSKIRRALDAAESDWIGHLTGPLDMGQVALGCALGYLDFRFGARNWRDGRPSLAAWEAELARRPSMHATAPHD